MAWVLIILFMLGIAVAVDYPQRADTSLWLFWAFNVVALCYVVYCFRKLQVAGGDIMTNKQICDGCGSEIHEKLEKTADFSTYDKGLEESDRDICSKCRKKIEELFGWR